MADKSGFLRNAMHMTRESKNSDLPLETRYVLMMMALERLDGKRQLEEGATARLLGVSDSVAAFINDLRNKLIHGQNGGGYEGAFLAVIEERFNGEIPDWPAPWSRCLLKSQGFDFMRFYFQVLERLDAYWCRHFGFEPEDKARFHIPTQSVVLPLPETYIPLEGDSRKCSDFQKQIDELVAACDKRDRKISEKNLQIKKQGERIQSLKAQLADKDKQIAEFQVQVTMIKSGEA